MWPFAILSIFLPLTLSQLDSGASKFAVDYFVHREVKIACLLVCEQDFWTFNLTRMASQRSLAVSSVKIDLSLNDDTVHRLGRCMHSNRTSVGVLVDSRCDNFAMAMKYASENSFLDATRKWLVVYDHKETHFNPSNDRGKDMNYLLLTLEQLNLSVDCDITVAERKGSDYELHEVYNFGKIQGGNPVIGMSGTWKRNEGLTSNLNEYKYYRRWNFHQWPMRMISVVSPPPEVFDQKMLTDSNPTPGIAVITKTSVAILNVVSELHNIRSLMGLWLMALSMRLRILKPDLYLSDAICSDGLSCVASEGSVVVVASGLYYKLQDISPIIRYMKEVHDRIDIVHPPLTSIETRYYYRIPTYGAGKFENQFLRPLSAGAWICVGVVIMLCALVLLIAARLEHRPSAGQYAVFSVLASICQQYFEDNAMVTRNISSARKLTVLVTGISCVIIYNYYTSSVVSWLLNGPPPSINSLEELLDSPLELIFEDIGYTRSWLQTPSYYFNKRNAFIEDELRKKKVFNKHKDAPLLENVEDGIRMVKAGGYAYHTEADSANRLISRTFSQNLLCEMGSLQSMEKTQLYACLQKNSPYREFFVWSLQRLQERGIVRCIQHRTSSPSVKCEGSSPRALALGGAAPAFLLLAGGYVLAVFIMLVERKIWSYKQSYVVMFKSP